MKHGMGITIKPLHMGGNGWQVTVGAPDSGTWDEIIGRIVVQTTARYGRAVWADTPERDATRVFPLGVAVEVEADIEPGVQALDRAVRLAVMWLAGKHVERVLDQAPVEVSK